MNAANKATSDSATSDETFSDVVAIGPASGLQYVRPTITMAHELAELERATFPTVDPASMYNTSDLVALATEFPEGGVVGFDGAERSFPIAAGLGVRTTFDFDHPQHSLPAFFDDAPTDCGDDPDGTWYYGTDIVVRPEYRRRGIGAELYDLRKDICRRLNLSGIVAGGVIPGFADHKGQMSADEYIVEVKAGRLYDRTLSFQLNNGFDALCALTDYMPDPEVDDCASLIVWHNPEYQPDGRGPA